MSNDTQLAEHKIPNTVKGWIESKQFRDQISKALPRHLTPDRMVRVALTTLLRTPKLAGCTPESVCKCLLDLSAAGLEPDGRRAHLIPFGTECTVIIDYKGLAELAMRSGTVSNIHADLVCDKDTFEADTGRVKHIVNYREPRGDPYAAYCLVRFKDGSEKAEVMSKDEIEAVRARSRAGKSGPWFTDWGEMAKKTVARRAFKWVPLSPEIRDAIEAEDEPLNVTPAMPEIRKPIFDEDKKEPAPEGPAGGPSHPDLEEKTPPPETKPAEEKKPEPTKPAMTQAERDALIANMKESMLDHEVSESKLFTYARKIRSVPDGVDELWTLPTEILAKLSLAIPSISTKKKATPPAQ